MNVCLFIEKILSKEPELEDYDVETSADWANDPVSQQPEADEAANSAQGFGQVCFRQLPVLYPPPSSGVCSHLLLHPLTCLIQVLPPALKCSGGEMGATVAQDLDQVWSFVSPLFVSG